MKIKIDKIDKIEEAIKSGEGSAKKRLLEYSDIIAACEKSEKKLSQIGIPKKYWAGCTISIMPEKVCNAYGHRAEGTRCNIKRFPSGWFVTTIYRDDCGSCAGGALPESKLHLSESAIDAIPKSFTL